MPSGPDQSNELSVLGDDNGSTSCDSPRELTVQLEYFDHLVLEL